MKLIIDIDEDMYKACQRAVNNPKMTVDVVDVAIANGTPVLTEGDLINRIDFWGSVIQSRKETIIDDDVKISMGELVDLLDNAPTVEAMPRGRWIRGDMWVESIGGLEAWGHYRICNNCKTRFKHLESRNYCSACGAIMEGDL